MGWVNLLHELSQLARVLLRGSDHS